MSETVSIVAQRAFASATNYEHVRSGYAVEAVEFLLQKLGVKDNDSSNSTRDRPFTILELGCGTGKFTRVMVEVLTGKNVRVIASDPMQSMCDQFKLVVPDTEIIQCAAEQIPLPDSSVDVVIAAQSFHWFTNRTALEEIYRVLVPNGSFGMMWKILDLSIPWQKHLNDFLNHLDNENSLVFPHREEWKKVFNLLSGRLFNSPEECIGFEHCFPISSFDHAYNHFASYSIIAGGSESDKKAFHELFNELMKKHFTETGIALENITFKLYMYWCHKEI
ncbi:hypothetical protein ACROYT_G008376 [Oculina patagonica]